MTDPRTGREPSLPIADDVTGREPFIGGEASIAQALLQLDDTDIASTDVLVARLAGALPQLAALLHDQDERKRSQAARLIGMVAVGHPRSRGQSVPLLITIMEEALDCDDKQIAEMAIDSLGETSDPLAAEAFVRVVSSGSMFGYMSRIILAFGKLGTIAVPSLLGYAGSDLEIDWLCDVLAEICRTSPEAIPPAVEWITPPLLNGQLMEHRVDICHRRLLRQLHSTPLVERMIEVVSDQNRDKALRRHLLLTLACIPDLRASGFMFELLTDVACDLRTYAARGLCRLRHRADIPRIIELIHHPNTRTCCYAITIAGKRKIKAAVPVLLEVLSNSHAEVRWRAVVALRRIGDSSAVPALQKMIGDRSQSVRLEVSETLYHL